MTGRRLFAVFGLLLMTLAACGNQTKKTEINLAGLMNTQGSYEYVDAVWGSSPEAIERSLDIRFKEPAKPQAGIKVYGMNESSYVYGEYSARISCEFSGDELYSLVFIFSISENDTDTLFSDIADTLIAAYGDVTQAVNAVETAPTTGYRWDSSAEDRTTSLQLMEVSQPGYETAVYLVVAILPK